MKRVTLFAGHYGSGKTNIAVNYALLLKEKGKDVIIADMDIVSVDTDFEDVDAIVVTAISAFDEIEEKLSNRVKCPILSLEDILIVKSDLLFRFNTSKSIFLLLITSNI